MSPVDFMVSVFRDEAQPLAVRLDAARSVAPYCHPRLSTVDLSSQEKTPVRIEIVRFTDDLPAPK
jgi:hypothetical protein